MVWEVVNDDGVWDVRDGGVSVKPMVEQILRGFPGAVGSDQLNLTQRWIEILTIEEPGLYYVSRFPFTLKAVEVAEWMAPDPVNPNAHPAQWFYRPYPARREQITTESRQHEARPEAEGDPEPRKEENRTRQRRWEDLEIEFLSDHRIQVRDGDEAQIYNYAEFGFEDRRTGRPSKAWDTLQQLAQGRGRLSGSVGLRVGARATASSNAWTKVEKRIQEIRKRLRSRYPCDGDPDPIPYRAGSGYVTRFNIRLAPSFDR
jgi:hypothetical protein